VDENILGEPRHLQNVGNHLPFMFMFMFMFMGIAGRGVAAAVLLVSTVLNKTCSDNV
jgi:hypothetical protein